MNFSEKQRIAIYAFCIALQGIIEHESPKKRLTARDKDRWVTLGGGEKDTGERSGRHVKIDEHGNIVGGAVPKSAQGKSITNWWKSSETHKPNKFSDPEPSKPISDRPENSQYNERSQYKKPLKSPPDMTAPEIADYFQMELRPDGHIYMHSNSDISKRLFKKYGNVFKEKASEIKKYLESKAEWDKYDRDVSAWENKKKLRENVPGISELEQIENEWDKYRDQKSRDIYSGAGKSTAKKPEHTIEEISRKYPAAFAYIKAQNYSNSSNYSKAAAGKKAMESIKNGEDYKKAIKSMESEWKLDSEKSLWNS